jgi:hypothetical protein
MLSLLEAENEEKVITDQNPTARWKAAAGETRFPGILLVTLFLEYIPIA